MRPGIYPNALVVTAVDNLPAQLAVSCSEHLSRVLVGVLPHILGMNMSGSLEESGLPEHLKTGFLTWKGELTPRYDFLREKLTAMRDLYRQKVNSLEGIQPRIYETI